MTSIYFSFQLFGGVSLINVSFELNYDNIFTILILGQTFALMTSNDWNCKAVVQNIPKFRRLFLYNKCVWLNMKGENKERWLTFYGVCCCWNLKISLCPILKHTHFMELCTFPLQYRNTCNSCGSPPSEGKESKNQNNLFRFIIPFRMYTLSNSWTASWFVCLFKFRGSLH
jgi:hypothetical protein